jgi:ribosomal protein S18 acetylase RimI-like enzyme
VAYVSNLAVAPTARRRGIGRALLRAAESVRVLKTLCDW